MYSMHTVLSMSNTQKRNVTWTNVPAYSRTLAARLPEALMRSIPFSSCTSGPLAIPGGFLDLT